MNIKKILLLAAVIMAVVASASAEYLEQGMYHYHHTTATRNGEFVYAASQRYVFDGDTVVGGHTYYKVMCYTDYRKVGTKVEESAPTLMALFREENGRIYSISKRGEIEGKVFYDFNIQPGEEVEICRNILSHEEFGSSAVPRMTVQYMGTGTVETAGKVLETVLVRKTVWYSDNPEDKSVYGENDIWIKGAGFIYGSLFANEAIYGVADPDLKYENTDVLYSADGKVICDYRDIKVLNSNVTGVSEVSTVSKGGVKYNIDGTQHHDGQKGVYVLDGKKYVER